jgi:hypothetical protein
MFKKKIFILSTFLGILILSNVFSAFINAFTRGLFPTYLYQTENAEFEFEAMPAKGRDLEMMKGQFSNFKESKPEYSKLEIRRTFKRNLFEFWNWYTYLNSDLYDFPYQKEVSI